MKGIVRDAGPSASPQMQQKATAFHCQISNILMHAQQTQSQLCKTSIFILREITLVERSSFHNRIRKGILRWEGLEYFIALYDALNDILRCSW